MIKNYYIHKDGIDKPVAKLTIHETLEFKKENIEIYERDLENLLVDLWLIKDRDPSTYPDNIVEVILEDRVIPSNRMFFAEQCKELGINPYSIDERLDICNGRVADDDFYVTKEFIKESSNEK